MTDENNLQHELESESSAIIKRVREEQAKVTNPAENARQVWK